VAWNHNVHHHRVVLDAMPTPCRLALDVGCGDGHLTEALAGRAERVVGVDLDAPSLGRARARLQHVAGVELIEGDLLTYPFEPGSFDLVAGIAVVHHLDFDAALVRMRELLRPGGVLAVVGLARTRSLGDGVFDLAGAVSTRVHRGVLRKDYDEVVAPVRDPTMSYGEVRARAAALLPGVRYRRHPLFRYSLVWISPATTPA
jgi:SAM-dependent methyltransferase